VLVRAGSSAEQGRVNVSAVTEASAMSAQLRMSSASCPPAPEVLTMIDF
jgi:hypothetical protein